MCGIYKITNLISKKVYIGQSVDINYRFNNHKSESFNPKSNAYNTAIHRAIRKYGIENFSFEVIEECTKELLSEREIYWIAYYNSYGDGYNLTPGGEGVESINRQIVYDLWDSGLSIGKIANQIQCNKHTVIDILREYCNYNNEESDRRGRNDSSKTKQRSVEQYDLNGNFIARYDSLKDAESKLGIPASNIRAVLRGEQHTAGEFQWILTGQSPPKKINLKSTNKKRQVVQLDLKGNYIKTYESLSDAAKSVRLKWSTSIMLSCQNKNKTAAGFYWRYKDEYEADLAAY